MIFIDNTTTAEGLGKIFRNLDRSSAKAGQKLASNLMKNPVRASELGVYFDKAAISQSLKAGLSDTPDVQIFYLTGNGFYLGMFEYFFKYITVFCKDKSSYSIRTRYN